MPAIQADFSKISHEYENLAAGVYRGSVEDISEGKAEDGKQSPLIFKLRVTEGEKKDSVISDFVYLKKKDGTANSIGLGRVKGYAIAVLGEEAANGAAIDTDQIKGGTIEFVVEEETYEKPAEKGGGQGKRSKVAKVLRAS
jgi:hypothetical protein